MLRSLQRWQAWLGDRLQRVHPSEGPGFLGAVARYELRRRKRTPQPQLERSAPYLSVMIPSCRPHGDMLALSLGSLRRVGFPLARVCVLNDCQQPLLDEDLAELRGIFPALEVLTSSEGLRLDTPRIMAELDALRHLSAQLAEDSWVMKADSDTLFLDDRLFRRVMAYRGDVFGHPVLSPRGSDNVFAQGGAMFFRVGLLRRMVRASTLGSLLRTCWRTGLPLDRCPEDNFLFHLAGRLTDRIHLERFMYGMEQPFDPEGRADESVVHFEHAHKRHMFAYAARIGLPVPPSALVL